MPPPPSHHFDHAVAEVAWVRRLALAIVHDAHQAEDVAQEAWLLFLRKRPSPGRGLAGWFRHVIRHLAVSQRRSAGRRAGHEAEAAVPEREEENPAFPLERLETQQQLLRAVRELDEPYRTVVLLRWFEGLEPAEIARRTGVPVRTVHTRTTRALTALREKLGRRAGADRDEWMLAWLPLLPASPGPPADRAPRASPLPFALAELERELALAACALLALLTSLWVLFPADRTGAPPSVARPLGEQRADGGLDALGSADPAAARTRSALLDPAAEAEPASSVEAASVRVRVFDAAGRVGHLAARIAGMEDARRLDDIELRQGDHPACEATLAVDRSPYFVQVYAELRAPLVLGPFEREPGTHVIEARLERLEGIRGRVLRRGGEPVAGALVTLHEAVPSGRRAWIRGLLARSATAETATTVSGRDGSFLLAIERPGCFWLRARKGSLADGEIGPLELDPRERREGLDVELSEGGEIEGRVLLDPGASLDAVEPVVDPHTRADAGRGSKLHVAASRGDGFPRVVTPDDQGRFRLRGLSPGPWTLTILPPDPGGDGGRHADDGPGETPAWSSCEVLEGATTHADVDLRGAARARLHVRLALEGIATAGSPVRVAGLGWHGPHGSEPELDARGELDLALTSGPYVVHATAALAHGIGLTFREQLVLAPGEQRWELDLATGALEGRVLDRARLRDGRLELVRSAHGLEATCSIPVGDDGGFRVEALPAGTWSVGAGGWQPSATAFVVTAGALARVELP